MIPQSNDIASATTTGSSGAIGPVIDLREGPTTRVRVARHQNPFSALSPPERMRLIIRVLCELVAYDELEGTEERQRTIRAAMDASEARAGRSGPRATPVEPGTPEAPAAPGAATSITG